MELWCVKIEVSRAIQLCPQQNNNSAGFLSARYRKPVRATPEYDSFKVIVGFATGN